MLTEGPAPDPKCKLSIYIIIPYTSTFNRLPHLYQEFYVHCIITNDEEMG